MAHPSVRSAAVPVVTPESDSTITRLLEQLSEGDRAAFDRLVPLVHDQLRALAHGHRLRWDGDETLGTTALVNEAYLKLVGQQRLDATSRAHFYAIAGKAMRQILSNYAESQRRLKRGGGRQRVGLDQLDVAAVADDNDAQALSALDAALERLEQSHERLGRVVECRFFAGLSITETATALGTSPATVKRDWTLARAWLSRELQPYPERLDR